MRDEPVMICNTCGRGFLVNPGSKIDPVPVWFTGDAASGGTCGGEIVMRNRRALITKFEKWEAKDDRASHAD